MLSMNLKFNKLVLRSSLKALHTGDNWTFRAFPPPLFANKYLKMTTTR